MINTGIIRKIDELGRVVLPKELRQNMNIKPGDDFEIFVDNEYVILKKYFKLRNKNEEIIKVLNIFNKNVNYKIYVVINEKIINNNEEIINKNIIDIINNRRIVCDEKGEIKKLSQNCIAETNTVIMPIIFNSDILGSIIATGNEKTNEMIKVCSILEMLIIADYV